MAEAPIALAMPAMALPPAPADDQAMNEDVHEGATTEQIVVVEAVVPQGEDIEMVV